MNLYQKHLAVVMGLLLAGAASAATPATTNPADRAAKNAERQAQADSRFRTADANADGKLNAAEWAALGQGKAIADFAHVDADADGGIRPDELPNARRQKATAATGAARERLAALDANQDGAWTRDELGEQAPRLSQNFATLDADGDGRLTREELRAARDKRGEARK